MPWSNIQNLISCSGRYRAAVGPRDKAINKTEEMLYVQECLRFPSKFNIYRSCFRLQFVRFFSRSDRDAVPTGKKQNKPSAACIYHERLTNRDDQCIEAFHHCAQ